MKYLIDNKKSKYLNEVQVYGKTSKVFTTHKDTGITDVILIDTEDLSKLSNFSIHTTKPKEGTKQSEYKSAISTNSRRVSHIVTEYESNKETVVDHINGNPLDNRKNNLRIITHGENANNRTKSRTDTGIPGISIRERGNYKCFRVQVTDINTPRDNNSILTKEKSLCKTFSKQFNINTLGEEKALKEAKKWLKEKRKEFGYINYK